jgi:YD repeat-containing protein
MNSLVRMFCAVMLSISSVAVAQSLGTGLYQFGSFDSRGFDSINLGNLNTHFEIPVFNKQGRGVPFSYVIAYDGMIWEPLTTNGETVWNPDSQWGFHGQLAGAGVIGYLTTTQGPGGNCNTGGTTHQQNLGTVITNLTYHDPYGRSHRFNYSDLICDTGDTFTGDGSSSDGSGYSYGLNDGMVHTRSGVIINAPLDPVPGGATVGSITDSNGNVVKNNGNGTFTDTLGVTALTIGGSGTAGSPLTLTYPVALQANSSTSATVTISYRTYTVQTNFQCSGIVEYGANSVDLIDHITLPDASASTYTFTYESTPGVAGAVTGRLASVTLPTGGTISYSYSGGCSAAGAGINPDGTVGSLTRVTSDGTRTYGRSPVNANATNTTVQDEKGNQSLYQFTIFNSLFYETHRQIYQGAIGGTPLLNQTTCYNGATNCDGAAIAAQITQLATTPQYNGGTSLTTDNVYDLAGMLTSSTQLNGSTVMQSTTNTYNGLEEVLTSTTTASGSTVASSTYGYDETTPTATSGIPQHVAAAGTRGNLTSAHVSTGGGTLTTTTTYYDTGAPKAVTTPNGTTSYGYDSTQTFATTTTLPTPSSGVALATTASYDPQSGVQISATGMNAGQTVQFRQYDGLLRPTLANLPNGGVVTTTYSGNDTIVDQTRGTGTGTDAVTHTLVDTYGRTSRVAVVNGQSSNPWYQVDSCYDATGLLQFQTVKYQANGFSTAKQCSGSGTSYAYDALGRVTSSTNADGTTTHQYIGHTILTRDVNGVQKMVQSDLLGRISGVCEISPNTLQGDTPVPCAMEIAGAGFLTTYAYTGLTTTVTQGAQSRVFTTDQAGRTTYVSEPERGVTTYSYTYSATSPCTGVGLCVTRTRPRANQTNASVTTTAITQYDSLGRPVAVTYSDGTPKRNYGYDAPVAWPIISQQNVKGMLSIAFSSIAFSSEATVYSYNTMGQIIGMGKCQPSGCSNRAFDKLLSYSYDLLGNVTSSSDGGGVTTSYLYSPASEVQSITSSLNDANHPSALVSNVQNGPYGPTSYQMGNGVTSVFAHDALGRLNGGFACTGSAQAGCIGGAQLYGYSVAWQGSRLQSSADTVQNYHATYGYDEFNRLTGLSVTSGSASSYSYVYDRYGNRWQQNPSGSGSGPALLDAIGIIPALGNLGKGVKLGIQAVQHVATVGSLALLFGSGSPTDAALTSTGAGLTAVDDAKVMTEGAELVPVIGNGVSVFATVRDIWGDEGMVNYYKDCMAGKN